jgi:hypothetical protein
MQVTFVLTFMAKETKSFVVTDESINSYGFRVLNKGGDFKQFKKNPVMLFNHKRYGENYKGPIGRWENLRTEGEQILADPVFDENDTLGAAISSKVENNFIRAASIGFEPIETSNDPKLMLPGQKYATVTKWRLVEISICDIPSNGNALALYDSDGNPIELTDEGLTKLNAFLPQSPKKQNMNKIELSAAQLLFLGLSDSASEAEVTQKLSDLKTKADKAEKAESELKTLKDSLADQLKNEITQLVTDAAKAGRIPNTKESIDSWISVLNADFKNGKALLSATTAPVKLTQLADAKGKKVTLGADATGEKTYDDYASEGTLANLKAENPEEFDRLLEDKKLSARNKFKIA